MTLLLSLAACAAPYRTAMGDLSGSYAEQQVGAELWHLAYRGQRYQTRETVQTFWLYRAAELTLALGYDGFAIQSAEAMTLPPPVPVYIPFGLTAPPGDP